MSINTNFNPNNGVLVANNTASQRASYTSGVYGNGSFSNKSILDYGITTQNRHMMDQSWETNNIYRISGNQIIKTSFDGTVLATMSPSITLNNPKSICVNQRMILPTNPSD